MKTIAFWVSVAAMTVVSSPAAEDVSTRRMAWAHYVGWTMPDQISLQPANFYSFPAYEHGKEPYAEEVRRAIAAGLDGFFVDVSVQYKWRPGFYYTVENLLKGAEGTDFRVAPCLDVKTDVSNQIDHVCWMLNRFGNHPNYPRVGDRYVIATYTYHEWKPEEWRTMIDGCAQKGFPLYVVGNVKPSCGVLLPNRLERYRDVFDACYSFAYTGRERLSVEEEDRGVAEWCAKNGKLFMPCIHPGYLAAWLRGSNPSYIPFQGVDAQMRCFTSACATSGQWLQFTSWNDHCETTLEPMLLTPGNRQLMCAMANAFKGLPPAADRTDVLLVYHREELPGTLLRFEALRLPSKGLEPIEVSGELHDSEGSVVAVLPSKKLNSAWERTEWLVPSGELVKSPHLTPRFTMSAGAEVRRATFSALYFRSPWIENQITVRETFADRADVKAKLGVGWRDERIYAKLVFESELPVKRAILFKNDRPSGQFAAVPPANGTGALPLTFSGNCRFDASFASGRVRMAMRKGNPPGRDGFYWDEHAIRNHPHADYYDTMSAWIEGPPDAEFILVAGGVTNIFTLPQLAVRRCITANDGKLTIKSHPDCTLREMPMLNSRGGSFRMRIFDREPEASDAYFARLELTDGRVCETETVYPFTKGGCVSIPVIESPITLETYPGSLSLPRIEPLVSYPEFLTSADDLPIRKSAVRTRNVARAVLRRAIWPLANDGVGMYDDRMVMDLKPEYFAAGPEGKPGLSFSGAERVRLPLLEWPMDTARIELEIAAADADGKTRSVIHRKGHGAAFTLRQLGDNRLEAEWSGVGKGGVWKVEVAERTSLATRNPIVPGRWTKVRLENDHRRLRIFLNDRIEAEVPFRAFRCFGPVTVFLGGGEENIKGYCGFLRNLKIGPCAD